MQVRVQLSKFNDTRNAIKASSTGDLSSMDADKLYDAVAKFLNEKFAEIRGYSTKLEEEHKEKK